MVASNNFDYKGENLVFVVGCPRSGTTWLQRLLACHPQIRTGQESHIFARYVGPQLRSWFRSSKAVTREKGLFCYFAEEEFLRIEKSFLLQLLQPLIGSLQPGELFLEKTPSHALFIPEIVHLLPEARIIHLLRDPRDVVASLLAAAGSWGSDWAPDNPVAATHMWVNHVAAAREASKALPSWQFLEIKYENIHQCPSSQLKRCSSFLGLQWSEDEILKAIAANTASISLIDGGTAIPLHGESSKRSGSKVVEPKGFIRKAKVGNWQTDLTFREKLWVWRVARTTMGKVGYHWPAFAPLNPVANFLSHYRASTHHRHR